MKNSKSTTVLTWEWPAGRQPNARIAVRVAKVEKKGGGIFGVGRSPSIVENLPDPIDLTGDLITPAGWLKTQAVEIVIPEKELPGIAKGDRMALGIVQQHIGICAAKIPTEVSDVEGWLARWPCAES